MTAKIVCRLMDVEGRMLGWCEHYAAVRGDGYLRASSAVHLTIDRVGRPATLSVHWCEVNTETRLPIVGDLSPWSIPVGQAAKVFEPNAVIVKVGNVPVGLPAVTVGTPVSIAVPAGTMGAQGNA